MDHFSFYQNNRTCLDSAVGSTNDWRAQPAARLRAIIRYLESKYPEEQKKVSTT